jgi:hypothetical protein
VKSLLVGIAQVPFHGQVLSETMQVKMVYARRRIQLVEARTGSEWN